MEKEMYPDYANSGIQSPLNRERKREPASLMRTTSFVSQTNVLDQTIIHK